MIPRSIPLTASVAVLCAGALLTAGCGKKDAVATTSTTTTVTTTTAPAPTSAPPLPVAGSPAELAQTAAVSPPANSNGTTPPSPGVGPPGGPGAAAATGAAPR